MTDIRAENSIAPPAQVISLKKQDDRGIRPKERITRGWDVANRPGIQRVISKERGI